MVMTAWLDGFKHAELREEVARQIGDASSSLTEAFDVAARIEGSFNAAQRRQEQRTAEMELEYYRKQARQGQIRRYQGNAASMITGSQSTGRRKRFVRFPDEPQDPALNTYRSRQAPLEAPSFIQTSLNEFVNGNRTYDSRTMQILCIR